MGSEKRLPPGPKGRFLTGHLAELKRDALDLYTRSAREFGDCVLLRFGLKRVYLLSHPDLIEQVLHSRNFVKHYALRMNRRLLGNGLLSSDGDFWLRQRRLMQPAFLRERITTYADSMVELAERLANTWQPGATRDVYADMRQLTLEIAARTLFGAEATGQGPAVHKALQAAMDSFNNRIFSVLRLPESFPTPANLRAGRAIKRLDKILYGIIERSRADGKKDDLLSILLHARDEEGTGMTDKQLRDEAMTLFLAGHHTTALALTWGWYLLAQHPEVMEQLRAELRTVLGGRAPTAADLPHLRYTEMVVQEVMRLRPPAYIIGRQAVEACEIGGYHLPAGGTVLMSQWVVQRDPRWWDDPERFYPGRWADGLAKRLPRYAYFPFGGGPRICIGNLFAMMEATLVLATLARNYTVKLVPGPPVRPKPRLTLAPDRGIEVVLERVT
jgi:cytochrome P450